MAGPAHLAQFFGDGELGNVGGLDQRAYPIDLRALAYGALQALHDFLEAIDGDQRRRHGLAAGGLLGQARDFQIAVVRHQERARNGRRGHDEDVDALRATLGL